LDQLDEADTPLSPDVADACQSTQLMDELEVVLLQLPLVCRQVFLWNKIEGYSQREIAERLGLSQSMVEKHMKRALTHLQTHLHLFQQD
jgi:RNA polymerase sigma-70 factor (ECF subfamily)